MKSGIDEKPMTVKECATWLGVSTWTIYRLAEASELPHLRVGTQLRFFRSDIKAYSRRQQIREVKAG